MGNIANKRGGGGGRNAPPDIYTPFGEIPEGPDADPWGAIADVTKFLVFLLVFGLTYWVWELMRGKR